MLRSYSMEEKVVSMILTVVVVVVGFQGLMELFRTPGLFADEGGIYTEGLVSDRATLINPVYADFSEANREISSLVFSGLSKYDPTLKNFVEDLGKLSISEDKKSYKFVIRDDVFWHDGQPLTAADVYFTYHDVIQSEEFQNPVLKANFQGVEVKQIDEKTIEFVLTSPNAFFITNLNVGILPKHLIEAVPVGELPMTNFNVQPVGTGPYKVESPLEMQGDTRQSVLLTLNDKYYGEKPKIQHIRFHVFSTSDLLLREQGTVNVIAKVPKDIVSALVDTNRFQFFNYELPQYTAVFVNMDAPVLKKEKVRIALQKAIDKDAMLRMIPNKTRVDTPMMELNQTEWLNKTNIDEAKGALFDSGYKMKTDAPEDPYRKDADGNNLTFVLLVRQLDETPSTAEEMQTLVNFLVEAWKNVGVEIDVQFETKSVFDERIRARDYDLVLAGESLGYNLDTYSFWHSSQANENG
ncbi:MAG TPA: ABC transporter substrate-binding protein, partial [Candidatus Gracilibacteria bacterium]|nr:ABC transporter substrate-binding protein [Candidatus Gracilibacteria bacterium]